MIRFHAAVAVLVAATAQANAERPAQGNAERPAQLHAETPPPAKPASLTLRPGVVAATLTLEVSAAKGGVLAPASVAPDLSVGVTSWLTVTAMTSGAALTGFRGSAGWGYCMTGTDERCPSRYTAGGLEALAGVARGSVALALSGGVIWSSQPDLRTDIKAGLRLRISDGDMFALVSPSVWIPVDDRDDVDVPHESQIWLPISVWTKPTPKLAVGVGTGVKGPAERFAARMSVPIGALFQLAVSPQVGFGSSLVFGKVLGGSAVMDAGGDARVLQIWLNLTSR